MTKRLTALGFAIVGVVWGPYVYAELARKPLAPPADAPAATVIEPTPVAYDAPAQERAQLLAALAEQRKAASAAEPEHVAPTEPAADEPALAEPAAAEAIEPATAAVPPAAATAETTAAAATEATLAPAQPAADHAAQPMAAPEHAALPAQPAAADPNAPKLAAAEEPSHAAKEPAEAEAKREEHSDDRHDEKADDKKSEKSDDKKEAAATPESLAPAFRSTFDRESRDAAWANGEEPRLTQMLAGAGVPASAIGEVRCQSTVCRVALNSVDVKAVQQSPLYQLLSQRVRDELGTLGLDTAAGDGEQHAAFYVLRKGAELSRDTN